MKNTLLFFALLLTTLFINASTPTGDSQQDFCEYPNPTIADIVVEGNNIVWFATDDSSGTPLPETYELEDDTTYYAFDGNDVASGSLAVTVFLVEVVPAPYGDSPLSVCEVANMTLAELPVFNTTGYETIFWYDDIPSCNGENGGNLLEPTTLLEDDVTYYASQSMDNGCCSDYLAVTIQFIEDVPAPEGEELFNFCETTNFTLADLPVFNTDGYNSIYWYSDIFCSNGQLLDPNTELQDGVTYYAYQTMDNGCCPAYLPVTVNLITPIPAPYGNSQQEFCENQEATLADLIVNNTDNFMDIFWFSTVDQQSGTLLPIETPLEDGITYYAYQGVNCAYELPVTVSITNCLSVDDNQIITFSLSPNPVKDKLHLEFNRIYNKVSLSIYNVYGSNIYKKDIINNDQTTIDVSKLNSGVYFISTKTDGVVKTLRFIKS